MALLLRPLEQGVQERRADKWSKWKDGGGAYPADELAELEDVEHLQVAAGLVALQVGDVLPEAATESGKHGLSTTPPDHTGSGREGD